MEPVTWKSLIVLAARIQHNETVFSWRRRMNPHHPPHQVAEEKGRLDECQRRDFFDLKQQYTANREALTKALAMLDDKTKKDAQGIADALEKCIADDVERTLLAETDRIDP